MRQLRCERVAVHVIETPGIGTGLVDAAMLIHCVNSDRHTFDAEKKPRVLCRIW